MDYPAARRCAPQLLHRARPASTGSTPITARSATSSATSSTSIGPCARTFAIRGRIPTTASSTTGIRGGPACSTAARWRAPRSPSTRPRRSSTSTTRPSTTPTSALVENKLLVGLDYNRCRPTANRLRRGSVARHTRPRLLDSRSSRRPIYQDGIQTVGQIGLYAQNQAKFADRFC